VTDLNAQTFRNFELIVVQGIRNDENANEDWRKALRAAKFPIRCFGAPERNFWVRRKKVAICAYRNAGIREAQGELIVNLDDACILPPDYAARFYEKWRDSKVALAVGAFNKGDTRPLGPVTYAGAVFGFGSYPKELALELNGYDEAFDGSQGLEDIDWSTRCFNAGLQQELTAFEGFELPAQTDLSEGVVSKQARIVKCCNLAWKLQRQVRNVSVANLETEKMTQREFGEWIVELFGLRGCPMLRAFDLACGHHGYGVPCGYVGTDIVKGNLAIAKEYIEWRFEEPDIGVNEQRRRRKCRKPKH
jgi:hypothetical protein